MIQMNHKFWTVFELELALPNLNKYTWNFQTLFRGCVNIVIIGIYKALDISISLTKLQLKNLQELRDCNRYACHHFLKATLRV